MSSALPSVSRRTVTRGAAWSTPVVALATVAPQFAASPPEGFQTITRNLKYRVFVKLNSIDPQVLVEDAPPYATPSGYIDQEVWDVKAETTLPLTVAPNTTLEAPPLSVTVVTSDTAAQTLRTFAVTSVEGSATPRYTVSGSVVNPGTREATLTVPTVTTPPTGGITTVAGGFAESETSTTAGTVTQVVGKFTSVIACTPAVPIHHMGLTGGFEPAGQTTDPLGVNYISFGSITVG